MQNRNAVQRDVMLIIVLCAVAYVPFLSGPFVYDDVALIQNNAELRDIGQVGKFFTPYYWNKVHVGTKGVFRPLREVVFTLIVGTVGPKPYVFHALSFLLHVLVTLLLYTLGRRTIRNATAVRFAALLFAVHPVHMEAVLWAKNLAELMAAAFVLTSFLMVLRALDTPRAAARFGWAAGATGIYALALLCKESGLALPLVVLLYSLFTAPKERRRAALAVTAPLLVLFILYVGYQFGSSKLVGAAVHGMRMDPDEALWLRPALAGKTYAAYYLLLLFPVQLCTQYHFAFPVGYTGYEVRWFLLFFLLLTALLLWAFLHRKRNAWILFWPALFLGPASNVIPFKGRPIGDQRLYVPSVGFCLMAGLAAEVLWQRLDTPERRRRAAGAVLGGMLALMLVLAYVRGPVWTNPTRFWFDLHRKSPLQSQAHVSLAKAYYEANLPWQAIVHADFSSQGDPLQSEAYALLSESYRRMGYTQDAGHFARLAQLASAVTNTLYRGRYAEAVPPLREMVALLPDNAVLLRSLAEACLGADMPEEAQSAMERANALDAAQNVPPK